jgi:endonuclease YncB( thermonuclease family)
MNHRRPVALALALALILLAASLGRSAEPATITGRVVDVHDGDTLTIVESAGVRRHVRLDGIDAPELRQPYGTRARDWLTKTTLGKDVRVVSPGVDKYRRTLGQVWIGDRWINRELVARGWAWHYRQYSDDQELAEAEASARKEKSGLWSGRPVEPWEWRKQRRAK